MSGHLQMTKSGSGVRNIIIKYANVTKYRDRHQKARWRYRKNGLTVNLGTDYGSEEFIQRYNAAVKGEGLQGQASGKVRSGAASGSLSHVVERWYLSHEFRRLAASTQKGYRRIAEDLRMEHGTQRVAKLDRSYIKALMASKASTPSAANNDLRVWRFVLDRALKDGLVEVNHARTIKKFQTESDGFHTWTEGKHPA